MSKRIPLRSILILTLLVSLLTALSPASVAAPVQPTLAPPQAAAPQFLGTLNASRVQNLGCFSQDDQSVVTAPPAPEPLPRGQQLFLPLIAGHAAGIAVGQAVTTTLRTDPAATAPPIDRSVASDIFEATQFLYQGADAIQTGVAAGTIGDRCVAILRGVVYDRQNQPLPDVAVTILDHPAYGQTLSRADGAYDLVVNGGVGLTMVFRKAGVLEVQRQIQPARRSYLAVEPVVMTALDGTSTRIDPASQAAIQVARGSLSQDGDGTRQATLFFRQGTRAAMLLPNGTRQALGTFHVRATEYTVGEMGTSAMPGTLPGNSGYTYAVEYSVDEAQAIGATQVSFNQPVISYVENFIGAPVGGAVPAGAYDRTVGRWEAGENGRVLAIVGASGGLAELDISGDGVADSSIDLAVLGIDDAERAKLAELFAPGTELWRVELSHFSPQDFNWPSGLPPGAFPPLLSFFNKQPDDPCQRAGSIISCETQTLGKTLPLAGLPYPLVYQSDRVPGWKVGNTLDIPLTPATLPEGFKGVALHIEVAGRQVTRLWEQPPTSGFDVPDIPNIQPNQSYRFVWDGKDAYGRLLQGRQYANIRVSYVWEPRYYPAREDVQQSFAQFPTGTQAWDGRGNCGGFATASPEQNKLFFFFCGFIVSRSLTVPLGPWDVTPIDGLGGWSLAIHHGYDPLEQVVHKGDGSIIRAGSSGPIFHSLAGGGFTDWPEAEGGLATAAELTTWRSARMAQSTFTIVSRTKSFALIRPARLFRTPATAGTGRPMATTARP